jgi:hypothetical protein
MVHKCNKIMKQNLFLALFVCSYLNSTWAQIVLQQPDFGLSTTTVDASQMKKTKKTGVALPTSGNNQIWDYSNLIDSSTLVYSFRSVTIPVTTPRPVPFATATTQSFNSALIQSRSGSSVYSYYRADATGFYSLGDSCFYNREVLRNGFDSIIYLNQIREYKPPLQSYKFPMTANTVWKNNARLVTNMQVKISSLGLDNAPVQYVLVTSSTDSVVGWGTLKMRSSTPGVILSFNALLVSNKRVETDSFYSNATPSSTELLNKLEFIQGYSSTYRSFYFLAPKFKAPYLIFDHDGNGGIENIFRAILPDIGLAVKIENLENMKVATFVFPNPTTDYVTFEFDKTSLDDWRVFIYNEEGQIIRNDYVRGGVGKVQHSTVFNQSLPTGIYFYQIIDDNSLIRNTGKVILNHE